MFLNSLNSDTFVLGINDEKIEGHWVYDSDGSPVTWTSWVKYRDYHDPPKQGREGNCAVMLRLTEKNVAGHRPQDWTDFKCSSNSSGYHESRPKSLICQKYTGE